jgi:hypothetical protein
VTRTADVPGLRFAVAPALPPPTLRSDVAAFLGRTRRGPVGVPVRVAGWREYRRLFGGLVRDAATPYGARGYFDNGGQVAHVVRLAGPAAATAAATMTIGLALPPSSRFTARQYAWRATSPGAWAEGTEIALTYRREGRSGPPEVDVSVVAPGEPPELHASLDPAALPGQLASPLVTVEPIGAAPPGGPEPGPRRLALALALAGGVDHAPALAEYEAAVAALTDVEEAALVAAPDLHADLLTDGERHVLLRAALRAAADRHDQLVLVDAPPGRDDARDAVAWLDDLRAAVDPDTLRSAVAYHPPLWVLDPLGGPAAPQRLVPPSGPVAGVISRLDRERGAHHTPANAPVLEAVDVGRVYDDDDAALLGEGAVNLLVCRCGRGLQVWGGRTLDRLDPRGRFVAHRRLVHRLVRAIRRVAEPLVFEGNEPTLWLTLTRAITSVLLEAFRAGALQGARAEEAFRVQCDETTNPPAERDLGRAVCLVSVAPAVPMEFITLRVAVSADGAIEVT